MIGLGFVGFENGGESREGEVFRGRMSGGELF